MFSRKALTNIVCQPVTPVERVASGMFLSVMGAGLLLAAWLLVGEGAKRQLIHDFAQAAKQGNIYALKLHTDWASVKENLKDDLLHRAHKPASDLPKDAGAVNELVEYYVRPDNLPQLLSAYRNMAGPVSPDAFVRDARLSGIREITVELGIPPQLDKPWLNNLEPVRAVFALNRKGWVLKKVIAPDYLIPSKAPPHHQAAKK